MQISKQEIGKTLLIAWFVVATLYVGYDLWNDYKIKGINAAYEAGMENVITKIVTQTAEGQCQPFDVTSGETKVQIIDASCSAQK
jgi:hypothetical protein